MYEAICVNNRELKRVPMDFSWPQNKVWNGYGPTIEELKNNEELNKRIPELKSMSTDKDYCVQCMKLRECSESASYCIWYNPNLKKYWHFDPPSGEGYQLWETCTEGSPYSPVFATLDELCAWCAENASVFADHMATKEQWLKLLQQKI